MWRVRCRRSSRAGLGSAGKSGLRLRLTLSRFTWTPPEDWHKLCRGNKISSGSSGIAHRSTHPTYRNGSLPFVSSDRNSLSGPCGTHRLLLCVSAAETGRRQAIPACSLSGRVGIMAGLDFGSTPDEIENQRKRLLLYASAALAAPFCRRSA